MMNTGDSDTNKTTIFLEYMNEMYVDRDFYSRGKIIEMAKDKYVELHGNVNNNKELKDTIVSKIKQRIESEYRKHPDLDWAEIAARKIYAEIFEETKDIMKRLGVIEVMRISSFGIPITTLLSDMIYGEHADKSVTISLIEDGHIPMRFAEDVINESKWAEPYRENYKKIWNLE